MPFLALAPTRDGYLWVALLERAWFDLTASALFPSTHGWSDELANSKFAGRPFRPSLDWHGGTRE